MPYPHNLQKAAFRHLEAGEHLYNKSKRKDVAGYLYGISAECAIKDAILRSSLIVRALPRKKDPIYAHFPDLKTLLRDHLQGRKGQMFLPFIDSKFMCNWDTTMRYAASTDIDSALIDLWRAQANNIINVLSGCFWR